MTFSFDFILRVSPFRKGIVADCLIWWSEWLSVSIDSSRSISMIFAPTYGLGRNGKRIQIKMSSILLWRCSTLWLHRWMHSEWSFHSGKTHRRVWRRRNSQKMNLIDSKSDIELIRIIPSNWSWIDACEVVLFSCFCPTKWTPWIFDWWQLKLFLDSLWKNRSQETCGWNVDGVLSLMRSVHSSIVPQLFVLMNSFVRA